MYKVSIFNNNVEEVIHYPFPSTDTPHLSKMNLKRTLNQASVFSFSISLSNNSYYSIREIKTEISIIDLRSNEEIFFGRVLSTKEEVSESGQITKEVECEDAFNILGDIHTRNVNFTSYSTASQILNHLLYQYNSMGGEYNFQLGTVEFTDTILFNSHLETIQSAILRLKDIYQADIYYRRDSGTKTIRIDFIQSFGKQNNLIVRQGVNLKSIIKNYSTVDLATRLIPKGAGTEDNIIDIKSVNGGLDYIEDAEAVSNFGVIEKILELNDIQDARTLLLTAQNKLPEYTKETVNIECSFLDLSFIIENFDTVDLGDIITIDNSILDLNNVQCKVIEMDIDLLAPYNPNISFTSRPFTLSNQLLDMARRQKKLMQFGQGSLSQNTLNDEDNINTGAPFGFTFNIPQVVLKSAMLNIKNLQYKYYTSAGVNFGTYCNTLTVKINNTIIKTINTGGGYIEDSIDITENIKNTGDFTLQIEGDRLGRCSVDINYTSLIFR